MHARGPCRTPDLMMKLYYHPASTVSRPVMMFIEDSAIPVELQVVDLFTGEHMGAAYGSVNPNHLVPTLEDGDFRLTESSAILKYLADSIDSPAYPKDLRQRARVNEMMDWINTQLCRDLAYNTVYAQIFPGHKRPTEESQRVTVAWGQERAKRWLTVLDQKLLGADKAYLCGAQITIADYYGASFVHLAEVIGSDLEAYPNVKRWLGRMKQRPTWERVYAAINGFAQQLPKGQLATV
jgi:glutathione S-transferase